MQLDSIRMGWNIYCMSFGGSSNPAIFTSGCRQDDSAARDWLLLGNLHQLATGMKVPLKRVCSLEILAFLKILTVRRALFHSTLDEWSDFREHLLTSFVPMKYWTTSTSWMLIFVKESFLIPRKKWLQQKKDALQHLVAHDISQKTLTTELQTSFMFRKHPSRQNSFPEWQSCRGLPSKCALSLAFLDIFAFEPRCNAIFSTLSPWIMRGDDMSGVTFASV